MAKRFSDLFSESYKEYKENFKYFVLVIALFLFIPSLIYYFFNISWTSQLARLGENANLEQVLQVFMNNIGSFIISSIIGIIVFLLSIFSYGVIVYGGLNKKKLMNFKESVKLAKANYLRILGFSLVLAIFTIGLFILLVIPGIIFGVFWCFSFFIFLDKKTKIIEALKQSFKLVENNWWKTFGYLILLILICFVINFAISFISGILNAIINPDLISIISSKNYSAYYSNSLWYINDIITMIFGFVSNVITIPLTFLFMKNFYLDRKSGKK